MKTIQYYFLPFFLFMGLGIFATPTNDLLEITAHLSQLSDPKERCFCSEDMEEIVLYLKKCRHENK